MTREILPGATMFERCVVAHQEYLDIGRRYLQAFGLNRGVGAIVEDMNEGRLPWEKAQQVLSHVHHLIIEHITRRVGFTRFSVLYKDPEFITLQMDSLAGSMQRHGPFAQERYARAVEGFAWTSLRLWHLVAHDLGGRHIYQPTPEVAELLRKAPPVNPWKTPRLPVPSLMLLVPPEARLTLSLKGFPSRDVTEIYAVEAEPPGHQWSMWIHAPIDERIAESVYLELTFPPNGTLEDGLATAHDMFQDGSPSIDGWKECVRWFAATMRYLAEGGGKQEDTLPSPEAKPEQRVLIDVPDSLH
ncbi:MAG: hypothetical protein ACJ8AT_11175 [Hyalangium sp.]|uniref:hypothetical protein n=1 Tax=Hyalangium sp. TaxID=2028555 RepID=UPI003899F734